MRKSKNSISEEGEIVDKKISVVVPIYKVEKYLAKCIESILNQTYMNLELILVDDGSPDNCGKLCDYYAQKDSRIFVIHKTNGGISTARNAGMKVATGDYICFVDSDDWVKENMLECLLNIALKYDADITVGGVLLATVVEDYYTIEPEESSAPKINCINKTEAIDHYLLEPWGAWNKLYKMNIHKHIFFPEGKIHEDEAIMFALLACSEKIAYTNEKLYVYVQRKGSITSQEFSLQRFDWFCSWRYNFTFVKDNYPQFTDKCVSKYCDVILYIINAMIYKDNDKYGNEIKEVMSAIRKEKKYLFNSKYIKLTRKIRLGVLLISDYFNKYEIYKWVYKILKKEA